MTKNLTTSVPDYLWEAMQQYPEVNWSQICRDAITSYINKRLEWTKPSLLNDLTEYLKTKDLSNDIISNIRRELDSKLHLRIKSFYKNQAFSEFKPEQWKDELYGQLENVTEFLKTRGYRIGTREFTQDEIRLFITQGDIHRARELRRYFWNFGLFAYTPTTIIFVYHRSQKPHST